MSLNAAAPPKHPALRLAAGRECAIQEAVPLDLPQNNRFSVSYASTVGRQGSLVPDWPAFDTGMSGEDSAAPALLSARSEMPPTTRPDPLFALPHFSRSESEPLPSQLSQLQHPHRRGRSEEAVDSPLRFSSEEDSPQVRELSFELADSIQMVVQTLLQISPPQVLDPAKEQFSACSLSVPMSSMSAMFTVMKNINYISANMPFFFAEPRLNSRHTSKLLVKDDAAEKCMEFDIGEMLQCVGDSLSGTAAQAGVDLVIYHGEVTLKHVSVAGDEGAIGYAISHVIRQVLNVTERGDSIQLGLMLAPAPPEEARAPSPTSDALQCTIRVSHKFAFPERSEDDPYGPVPEEKRRQPSFSSLLLRRILRQISGSLIGDLPPPDTFPSGRTIELTFPLSKVQSTVTSPLTEAGEEAYAPRDPNFRQVLTFSETLKGKKASLYASSKGCFAQHLTSYLTSWGMDVTHISPDGNVDGLTEALDTPQPAPESRNFLSTYISNGEVNKPDGVPPDVEARRVNPGPPSFILIDDDVDVLKQRLQALRSESTSAHLLSKKRPPLTALHRPRSAAQVPHTPGQTTPPKSPVVILHFTSLSNYKHLKELIQSIMTGYTTSSTPLPEVMIIPKPAGPRRLLTALQMAVTKPSVDPQFTPIATSPMSPGIANGSFFTFPAGSSETSPKFNPAQPTSPTKPLRPAGSRSNSDRSMKSIRDVSDSSSTIPPSPLAMSDNVEYFSVTSEKLGSTPSSGLVIQSPDGQPAGIFFHPKTRSVRTPATPSMERDKGQLGIPNPRKPSAPRVSSNGMLERAPSIATVYTTSSSSTASAKSLSTCVRSNDAPADGVGASPTVMSLNGPSPPEKDSGSPGAGAISPTPSTTKAPIPPSPRKPSARAGSPPGPLFPDASSSIRRGHARKGSQGGDKETAASSSGKKGKAPENSIVLPIRVLIVDDNPINQTILSTWLKKRRIYYDIANNGQEAVQKWRDGTFHLILMDIQMPIMDGIQATKEIRRMEKTIALAGYAPLSPSKPIERTAYDVTSSDARPLQSPYRSSVIIVALTASSLQSDRVAALAAGCNDFLTKPVSLLWLNNKILEWGSIKALQMWADPKPDAIRDMDAGQAVKARVVADRLHMPKKRDTSMPKRSSSLQEESAAALALASPSASNLIPQALKGSVPPASSGDTKDPPELDATALAPKMDHLSLSETPRASPPIPSTHGRSRSPEVISASPRFTRVTPVRGDSEDAVHRTDSCSATASTVVEAASSSSTVSGTTETSSTETLTQARFDSDADSTEPTIDTPVQPAEEVVNR